MTRVQDSQEDCVQGAVQLRELACQAGLTHMRVPLTFWRPASSRPRFNANGRTSLCCLSV
jgi:hypothetical protein